METWMCTYWTDTQTYNDFTMHALGVNGGMELGSDQSRGPSLFGRIQGLVRYFEQRR